MVTRGTRSEGGVLDVDSGVDAGGSSQVDVVPGSQVGVVGVLSVEPRIDAHPAKVIRVATETIISSCPQDCNTFCIIMELLINYDRSPLKKVATPFIS